MNILISLLYAPCVFYALRYFDISLVSIFLLSFSFIWFLVSLKVSKKESFYPLLYMILAGTTFILDDFIVLKAIPLLLSMLITLLIGISYLQKNSLILYFAKRFSKKKLSFEEQNYIHQSTLFWIGVSMVNIVCHFFVFMNPNIQFWVFYSSLGWYGVFLIAGVLQFLHRHFVFLKSVHV